MSRKSAFPLLFIPLAILIGTAVAQEADSILDVIARSLPQMESGWTYEITPVSTRQDGAKESSIKWNKGNVERGATVIVYPTVNSAKSAFRPSGKQDLHEEFRIDGVGDEEFLWPPKTPEGGAYNMRFRKTQVEIWLSGETEEDVKGHAMRIAASIASKGSK